MTTAKDFVRLKGVNGKAKELLRRSLVIEIEMTFDDPRTASHIIDTAFENWRSRRLYGSTSKFWYGSMRRIQIVAGLHLREPFMPLCN